MLLLKYKYDNYKLGIIMKDLQYITYKLYSQEKEKLNKYLEELITIELNHGKALTRMANDIGITPLTLSKFLMGGILSFTSVCKAWSYFYNKDKEKEEIESIES